MCRLLRSVWSLSCLRDLPEPKCIKTIVSYHQFLYMKVFLLKKEIHIQTIPRAGVWTFMETYLPVGMLSLGRAVAPVKGL